MRDVKTTIAKIIRRSFDENLFPAINKHARNLTLLAMEGKLDTAYCREKECERIAVLTRRKIVPNVMLVGKAGCGKTAIVEQFAINTVAEILNEAEERHLFSDESKSRDGECYEFFKQTKLPIIYEIESGSLIGGARYRGDFEERLANIINEVRTSGLNVLIFFDEAHLLTTMGISDGSSAASQYLKPALARGDIRIIGATTEEEFAFIEKDKALMRRFNILHIDPIRGNRETIATNIARSYTEYHSVSLDETVSIKEILNLLDMHFDNAIFPNCFINIIDEACAAAAYHNSKTVTLSDINKVISSMTGHLIISNS